MNDFKLTAPVDSNTLLQRSYYIDKGIYEQMSDRLGGKRGRMGRRSELITALIQAWLDGEIKLEKFG